MSRAKIQGSVLAGGAQSRPAKQAPAFMPLFSQAHAVAGRIAIFNLPDGKVWLQHVRGEGMECHSEALGEVVEKFFEKHF